MLHNGVFSILMLMIAIALVGFTFAAVAGRLIGARWRTVGAIGAGLLLLSPFAAPAVAEGSPVFAISGIGFVLWIVSLIRISVALGTTSTDSGRAAPCPVARRGSGRLGRAAPEHDRGSRVGANTPT